MDDPDWRAETDHAAFQKCCACIIRLLFGGKKLTEDIGDRLGLSLVLSCCSSSWAMSVTIEGVGFQAKEGLVDNSNKFIHNYPIIIKSTLSQVSPSQYPFVERSIINLIMLLLKLLFHYIGGAQTVKNILYFYTISPLFVHLKNPAYGRHQLSRCMRIVAPMPRQSNKKLVEQPPPRRFNSMFERPRSFNDWTAAARSFKC